MKPNKIVVKMEQSIDVLSFGIDEQSSSIAEIDPLGLEAEGASANKSNFYRLNKIVFAEPLKTSVNEENSSKENNDNNEIRIIENVIIQKEPGKKYNKYHFNIEDGSSAHCPQPNCLRSFSSKNHLLAHIRRVHCADRTKYICEQCGSGFPEQHLLKRHLNTHSEDTVQCPVCGVKLRLRTGLQTHLRTHSNIRSHECEICKKTFTRASTKEIHVKFVHRKGLLECKECEKRFSSRKQWSMHMATHRLKKLI